MRYELADFEWAAIKPMLPNKPPGVPRVNDRRVLAFSGSGDPEHPRAICRRLLVPTRLAITASSAGGGPAYGAVCRYGSVKIRSADRVQSRAVIPRQRRNGGKRGKAVFG